MYRLRNVRCWETLREKRGSVSPRIEIVVKYFRTPCNVQSRVSRVVCAIDEINTRRLSCAEMSIDLFAVEANATLTLA